MALLEAGSEAPDQLKVPGNLYMALAGFPPSYKRYNWNYLTPNREKYLLQSPEKIFYHPKGKILGGTSQLNGMIYIRGNKSDYDDWGIEGWDYESVLEFFKKSEKNSVFRNRYHSQEGEIPIQN